LRHAEGVREKCAEGAQKRTTPETRRRRAGARK
jgi:hypothetical protein